MLEQLQYIALYVPDVPTAVQYYQSLGLQRVPRNDNQCDSAVRREVLRFRNGTACLVLHDDPHAQFPDVAVTVPNVVAMHRQLSLNPAVVWLVTPSESASGREAVLRGPDGNVMVLREAMIE